MDTITHKQALRSIVEDLHSFLDELNAPSSNLKPREFLELLDITTSLDSWQTRVGDKLETEI